jgi:hypothetical protein
MRNTTSKYSGWIHSSWLLPSVLMGAGAMLYGQVSAPVLGFVPEGSRVRPVFGMAAAAFIAPPMASGRDVARMAASPAHDYMLASAADNGDVVLISPDGSMTAIKTARISPDEIVVSPEGSAAMLWFASMSHAQVITGLPRAPQVREIDATFLGPNPYALSISDDGQWLAGSWRAGNYAFGPHGEVNRLPLEDIVSALGFLHGKHDLAMATHEQVLLIGDVGGANQASVLVTGMGRLDAMALGISGANQKLVIADPRGKITSVDLGSGTVQSADCSCSPEGLFPMGRATFRLTGLIAGAFQIFDSDTGQVLAAPILQQDAPADGGQQ